eukprot:10042198-Ditylum_brightwellii.AAC.1
MTQNINNFASGVDDFIVTYHIPHKKKASDSSNYVHVSALTITDIEKSRKQYKSYYSVGRSDTAWCGTALALATMKNVYGVKN